MLKGRTRVARITGTAKAGRNKIAWNGKQRPQEGERAASYTLRLAVTGGDGQTATDSGRLTLGR